MRTRNVSERSRLRQAAERVAGAARLLLMDRFPDRLTTLPAEVGLELLGQVVRDHQHPIDHWGKSGQRPVEDGPALHGQQGFGGLERVGAETSPEPRGQDDGVHW